MSAIADDTDSDSTDLVAESTWAWSDVDEVDEPVGAPWRAAAWRALALVAGGLLVAGVVVAGWMGWLPQRQEAQAPTAATVTPAASAPPQAPLPPPAPASPVEALPSTSGGVAQKMTTPPAPIAAPDPDTIYLQLLSDAGVKAPTNEKAIANGHLICEQLGQGNTVQAVVAEVGRVNPSLSPAMSKGTVYAAIDAYCPQYENRGEY
ncbi:DUF732 domain-containing protein [Mycobacterium colombiense]